MNHALSRRTLLAQAAACGGPLLAIAGRRGPVRRGDAHPATLTIAGITGKAWVDAVTHAWRGDNPDFELAFGADTACGAGGGADLFVMREEDVLYVDALSGTGLTVTVAGPGGQPQPSPFQNLSIALAPVLRTANFDPAALLPAARAAFSDFRGRLAAFPLLLGEVQCYANPRALAAVGMSARAAWTLDLLEEAVATARGFHGGAAPLIVGAGWSHPNMWSAWVRGTGGSVRWTTGAVDLAGALPATERLVRLARAARWDPFPTFAAGTPAGDFARHGFAGSAAGALFGFASPPYLAGLPAGGFAGRLAGPTWVAADVFARGGVQAVGFPALPAAGGPIPGVGAVGLALAAGSKRGLMAAQFLSWLYGDRPQRLLAGLGLPPITAAGNVQAFWAATQGAKAPSSVRFDARRYWDVVPHLPTEDLGAWTSAVTSSQGPGGLSQDFGLVCRQMYGGRDVRAALAAFQSTLRQGGLPLLGGQCP